MLVIYIKCVIGKGSIYSNERKASGVSDWYVHKWRHEMMTYPTLLGHRGNQRSPVYFPKKASIVNFDGFVDFKVKNAMPVI